MQKLILFGASNLGKKAYEDLHQMYDVLYFCDNDKNKHWKEINGTEIIPFNKLLKINNSEITIVITSYYISEIEEQLIRAGVHNYLTYEEITILTQPIRHKRALEQLRNKEKIKVAFFVLYSSIWKLDGLFRLMMKDARFDPIIIVCPVVNYGIEHMLIEMEKTYKFFVKKNYNVIKTYNVKEDTYLDVKKEIDPDIIFYTNPHLITKEEYYITHYKDVLSCYVPYVFHAANINELQYNQLFHNILWRAFYETDIHKKMASKYAINKGRNVVVSGYPGVDDLIFGERIDKKVWSNPSRKLKRVIWAPHHTIELAGDLRLSNFLRYHQFMLEITELFKEDIQIAFKPHPLLKNKLYAHKEWGKKRTDDYFNEWELCSNGQLETDDYIDLFNTSDAMILDSISFVTEYLCCGKPSLFLFRDENVFDRFNEFGKLSLAHNYHGYSESDIMYFLENIVIKGEDNKKKSREKFYTKYLLPPKNNKASINIYYEICKSVFGGSQCD